MKNNFKPQVDNSPIMIITGILTMYLLIVGFIFYLYILHRINLVITLISIILFTVFYLPRLFILKKLNQNDDVKIIDNFIMINGVGTELTDIENFGIKEQKPKVIFFLNNRMVIYQEAEFVLKAKNEDIRFRIIGSEKISLLKEFLSEQIKNNKTY